MRQQVVRHLFLVEYCGFDRRQQPRDRALPVGLAGGDDLVAARVLEMENEIGRLAPGMSADIIAVTGDPLADVTVLEKVEWVMVRGRVVE